VSLDLECGSLLPLFPVATLSSYQNKAAASCRTPDRAGVYNSNMDERTRLTAMVKAAG